MSNDAMEALARLVALKDGPKYDGYRANKEAAWQAARDVVAGAKKCHQCGRLNGPAETWTRLDGTPYCLYGHRDHT